MDSKGYSNDLNGGGHQTASLIDNNNNNSIEGYQPAPFEEKDAPQIIIPENMKRDALETRHKVAYAVGHLSNDLCAAGWFFYLVFYLNYIVKLTDE